MLIASDPISVPLLLPTILNQSVQVSHSHVGEHEFEGWDQYPKQHRYLHLGTQEYWNNCCLQVAASMARRSSYASVLAGSAGPAGPARSGFMAYSGGRDPASIQHTRSPSTPQPSSRPAGLSQSYSGPGRSTDRFDPDDLPPYSSSLGTSVMESRSPPFYIPSYLKYSRHAEKLEEKHKTRVKAQRDGTGRQSNGGALSRSSSGINIHKIVPSHRGMTYDIQEKFVGYGEEVLAPLPSRWSSHAKCPGLEISLDGFEVTYVNPTKNASSDEAASLRADHSMPKACGIYYYEITVMTKGKDSYAVCDGQCVDDG